jgi:hypothetical protein
MVLGAQKFFESNDFSPHRLEDCCDAWFEILSEKVNVKTARAKEAQAGEGVGEMERAEGVWRC